MCVYENHRRNFHIQLHFLFLTFLTKRLWLRGIRKSSFVVVVIFIVLVFGIPLIFWNLEMYWAASCSFQEMDGIFSAFLSYLTKIVEFFVLSIRLVEFNMRIFFVNKLELTFLFFISDLLMFFLEKQKLLTRLWN